MLKKIDFLDQLRVLDFSLVKEEDKFYILWLIHKLKNLLLLAKVVGRAKSNFIEGYIWQL